MHGDACMCHSAMLLLQCVPAASMSQPQTGLGVTGVTQTTSAQGGDKAEMPISRGTRFSCGPNLVTRNTGARTPIDCGETGAGSKSLLQHRCGCTRLLNGCGSIHMGALAIRVESATAAAAACDCMIWKHDRTCSCCGELLLPARFSCGRAHYDPQP